MRGDGILASELIRQLQDLIAKHGDQEVYAGGTDYPEGVSYVTFQERDNNPYVPLGTFEIW